MRTFRGESFQNGFRYNDRLSKYPFRSYALVEIFNTIISRYVNRVDFSGITQKYRLLFNFTFCGRLFRVFGSVAFFKRIRTLIRTTLTLSRIRLKRPIHDQYY